MKLEGERYMSARALLEDNDIISIDVLESRIDTWRKRLACAISECRDKREIDACHHVIDVYEMKRGAVMAAALRP